jgi:hypothetical protein
VRHTAQIDALSNLAGCVLPGGVSLSELIVCRPELADVIVGFAPGHDDQ